MTQAAKVNSVEALRDFQQAMASFCEKASNALVTVQLESRRVLDWLQHDQPNYWKRELRDRQEEMAQARTDLNRVKLSRVTGSEPDCTEQIKALRKAQARVTEAEEKLKNVRRWTIEVQRAMNGYEGQARQLADFVEGDPPRSIAVLDRIVAALDAYLLLAPPVDSGAAPASSVTATAVGVSADIAGTTIDLTGTQAAPATDVATPTSKPDQQVAGNE